MEAFGYINRRWPSHFRTYTNTALVATLCIATIDEDYQSWYHIFQSTIPRGRWRDHMLANGSTEAPQWWSAANSQPLERPPKLDLHAEDSVEYLANHHYGPAFNDDTWGQARLIVYGLNGGEFKLVRLCERRSMKNPTCTDIAQILNIMFLPKEVSAAGQDEIESRPAAPPGNSDQGQGSGHASNSDNHGHNHSHDDHSGGYQADPTGGHGYGDYGSTSYHHHDHRGGGSHHHRDEVPRSHASTRHADLSSLTSGMSALCVSSSNGSKSDTHRDRQTSSRDLAVSSHARSTTEHPSESARHREYTTDPREHSTARPRESTTARSGESTTARPRESTADRHRHEEHSGRETTSARKSSHRTTASASIQAPTVKYRSTRRDDERR